jgi:hypothetical protein
MLPLESDTVVSDIQMGQRKSLGMKTLIPRNLRIALRIAPRAHPYCHHYIVDKLDLKI